MGRERDSFESTRSGANGDSLYPSLTIGYDGSTEGDTREKLHPMMAKIVDAVKTAIRRESPAPAGERGELGWRNPPESRTPRDDEWDDYRVRRDRDIIHRHYTAQVEWREEEAARQEEWIPREPEMGAAARERTRNRQRPPSPASDAE